MARPSKLTPEQWADIDRRMNAGEKAADLAREYGVNSSQITRRVTQVSQKLQNAAQTVAIAQTVMSDVLAEFPAAEQYKVLSMADKLRSISNNLASAAELGAKTAHRLHALANSEVAKVDDADPLQSMEALKGVAALAKLGNESAAIALNLLAANKETVQKINDGTADGMHPTVIELVAPDARTA